MIGLCSLELFPNQAKSARLPNVRSTLVGNNISLSATRCNCASMHCAALCAKLQFRPTDTRLLSDARTMSMAVQHAWPLR